MTRWFLKKTKTEAIITVGKGGMKFGFPVAQYEVVRLLVVAHNAEIKAE